MSNAKKRWVDFDVGGVGRTTLAQRVADGIIAAIAAGGYAKGDVLPSRKDIAERLGVGEITVRSALAKLTADGHVTLRRGVGCVISGMRCHRRVPKVLDVMGEDVGSFSACITGNVLHYELSKSGFKYEGVALPSGVGERDYLRLLQEALGETPDFVIVRACNERFDRICRVVGKTGIPYVGMFGGVAHSGHCVGNVVYDASAAVDDFVADCVKAGVRSVLHVDQGVDSYIDAVPQLEKRGVVVERLSIGESLHALADLDALVAESAKLMSERLKAGPLPDLVFIMNDFIAGGVISTLLRRGVRIPQDVAVVAYVNRGSGFFFPKPFACLEYDSRACAREIAGGILKWFRTGLFPKTIRSRPVYCRGVTFPV